MRRSLSVEGTGQCATILGGSKSLETFRHNCRVFTVVVGMHLDVRRADVHLVTMKRVID